MISKSDVMKAGALVLLERNTKERQQLFALLGVKGDADDKKARDIIAGLSPAAEPTTADVKPSSRKGRKLGNRRENAAARQQTAEKFLVAHPGTKISKIAKALGLRNTSYLRHKVLQPIGRTEQGLWYPK